MSLRLTGFLGGLATASALALAACGGDEKTAETVTDESSAPRIEKGVRCLENQGYSTDVGRVSRSARRDGTTGVISVLLDLEGGTAVDNVVDVNYWDWKAKADRYVKEVGDGSLGDLHHEQLGTVTITYAHGHSHQDADAEHAHAGESDAIDHEVEAIAACVA